MTLTANVTKKQSSCTEFLEQLYQPEQEYLYILIIYTCILLPSICIITRKSLFIIRNIDCSITNIVIEIIVFVLFVIIVIVQTMIRDIRIP